MKSTMNSFVEPRREWTAPELKKVDLKQITAHLSSSGNDGNGGHTAS
jgi:hypothetical protein